MRSFPASFALLSLHESCRGGCCHPDCRRTHELAAEPCAGCGLSLGMDRAFMTRDCSAHVMCIAERLCKIVGGGASNLLQDGGTPTGPRPAQSLSAGVILPPPALIEKDAAA